MQFVTFGLLFGLGTLLWCLAISVTALLRGDRNADHPWHPVKLQTEEPDRGAEAAYPRSHAA